MSNWTWKDRENGQKIKNKFKYMRLLEKMLGLFLKKQNKIFSLSINTVIMFFTLLKLVYCVLLTFVLFWGKLNK